MSSRVRRWGAGVMTVMLVVSIAVNIVCLRTPSAPSSDALFLFHDDAQALSMSQTGAVAGFLPGQRGLPDGWLPLQGQRIQRREHPGLYTRVRHNLGVSGDEEGVNLPDYRGLAVMSILGFGGIDEETSLFPWSAGGWIGHLGATLVPREAQASPPGSVVGLTPIVWAIKT